MAKIADHEKRPWVSNRSLKVPTRKRGGICRAKNCKRVLSKYNLSPYCFTHKHLIVKEEDCRDAMQYLQQLAYYRKKAKAKK